MNLLELARVVFQTELENMQLNLAGYVVDLDPIHLHDLRVAERRTRAALSEFKILFPDRTFWEFREHFRWLHQITNQVRDLDVGISHFPYYRRKISPFQRANLQPALALLQDKRLGAQQQLAEILKSGRLEEILQLWSTQLEAGITMEDQAGQLPAAEYGSQRIWERYQTLRNKALALTPQSPASDFHTIRISVKKLRYQIEFYNLALKKKRVTGLLRRLKRFQDTLGGYQDAVVQVEHIHHLTQELVSQGVGLQTREALDRLVNSYHKKITLSNQRSFRQVRWLTSLATLRTFQRCFGSRSLPDRADQ